MCIIFLHSYLSLTYHSSYYSLTSTLITTDDVDREALSKLFSEYDGDKKGTITIDELELMLAKLGVAPMTDPNKRASASSEKPSKAEDKLSAAGVEDVPVAAVSAAAGVPAGVSVGVSGVAGDVLGNHPVATPREGKAV